MGTMHALPAEWGNGGANVEVLKISASEWRIRDARRPANDPRSLCGLVTERGELFEVFTMGDPLARRYFDSLAAAVISLAPFAATK